MLPIAMGTSVMACAVMKIEKKKIPEDVLNILKTVESGNIKNINIEWSNDDSKLLFSADSLDGTSRITIKREDYLNPSLEKEEVRKSKNKQERLERVTYLYEQGKTQQYIANYVKTSQKTISNDIKELGLK